MNFLFDLTASQPNEEGDFHGGGKYAKKILFAFFSSQLLKNWRLIGLYDSTKPLDVEIKLQLEERKISLIDINNTNIKDVVEKNAIKRIFSALPDKFFSGYNLTVPFFSTIHGLRFIELKATLNSLKYYSNVKSKFKAFARIILSDFVNKKYTNYYQDLLRSSTVIAVSNHTKFSIKTFFPEIKKNIEVFYAPDVTEFSGPVNDDQEKLTITNYFLLVSGNRWIKNNLRSLIALDEVFSEHPEINQNVVITGIKDAAVFTKYLKNRDRFIFYKYVSEGFLNVLYQNAFAFIYMSLNEGFGYPPLEAMKTGVPVITSPFTSIPEVCGDAVLYCNPYSVPEIKNRILQLKDTTKYQELKEKGTHQYLKIRLKQDGDLVLMTNLLLRS